MVKSEIAKIKYDDRKARAMAGGTVVEYVSCPMCAASHPIKHYLDGTKRFDTMEFAKYEFISVRKGGGGKGSGFFWIPGAGKTMDQAGRDPNYTEIISQIRTQAKKILTVLGR